MNYHVKSIVPIATVFHRGTEGSCEALDGMIHVKLSLAVRTIVTTSTEHLWCSSHTHFPRLYFSEVSHRLQAEVLLMVPVLLISKL